MSTSVEPVAALNECFAELERATEAAVLVSEANIGVHHTGRQNRALFLFAKLIAHDMSLLAILNCYNRGLKGSTLLDHFSIAALARTVIDASVVIMYISHPSLTRDQWNLRRYVLYLHELDNRKRFLSSKLVESDNFLRSYAQKRAALVEKIKHFCRYLQIEKAAADELISGQKVYVGGVRGAAREAGWDVKVFDTLQSYLSAYVHSYPVSFMRAEEQKISFSDPSDFQLGFCGEIIRTVAEVTERVRQRMIYFSVPATGDPLGQVDD